MSEVKVAFVGAGGNASGHMNRVNDIEGARLVAICDLDEGRAKEAAGKFNAKAYTDQNKMIDAEDFDALYVSVPPFAHTDAEIKAAQKGAAVLVEKPVAITMDKGLEVWEAIKKAGVISCVGYQVRYVPTVDLAKKFLEGKTIAMVNVARWGGLPPTPWWRVMSKSGGQIVEQTTHQVDMIRCLCGEITEVCSNYALRMLTDVENLDVPDVMAVTFKMACGAVGCLTSSCGLINGGGKGDFDVVADKSVLKWSSSAISAVPGEHPELAVELPASPTIDQVFVEAVRTKDASKIRSDYFDALKSLDVCLAMNDSAETGKPVVPYFAK